MTDESPEIILLSSDEETSPEVPSVKRKDAKYQNMEAKKPIIGNKDAAISSGMNLKSLSSASKRPVLDLAIMNSKTQHATARKTLHSPYSSPLRQPLVKDTSKRMTHNKSLPVQTNSASSNLVSVSTQKKDVKTLNKPIYNNSSFLYSSKSDLAVIPVSGNQKHCKTSVNEVKASISITKLKDTDSDCQRKARKSLQNSKFVVPESLKFSLSKGDVSITNISKDNTSNAVSSANASINSCNQNINLENSLTHSNINKKETRSKNCIGDTSNKSLSITPVGFQGNARTVLKNGSICKLLNSNNNALSVSTNILDKDSTIQNVKPSKSKTDFTRSKEGTARSQILQNPEISIIKVGINEKLNSPYSESVKTSKASALTKPMSSQTHQMKAQVSSVTLVPLNAKKQKLEKNVEQIKSLKKLNSKTSISVHGIKGKTPLNSASKCTFSNNKKRITLLKESLDKFVCDKSSEKANITVPSSNTKSLKEINLTDLLCEAASPQPIETVSTDVEMKSTAIQRIADRQEEPVQVIANCSQSLISKLENDSLTSVKDQTGKQAIPVKQITSPKLSRKRKTYITSDDDQSLKRSKVEKCNSPSTSTHTSEENVPWKSSDDGSTKLKKLLDFSVPIMKKLQYYQRGEENKISKSLLKCLNYTKLSYISSNQYDDLLCDTFENIKSKPKELFQHLMKMKGTLTAHKSKELKTQCLKSSISLNAPKQKDETRFLESSIPPSSEISKVQSMESSISISRPSSLHTVHSISPKSSTVQNSSDEVESTISGTSSIVANTSENPKIQRTHVVHASNEVEPTSVNSSILHENVNIQPIVLKSCNDSSDNIDPTSMCSTILHRMTEKVEMQPISLTSIAQDTSETVEPTSAKSSDVQSTLENQAVSMLSPSNNFPENKEIEMSLVSSTEPNPPGNSEFQPISPVPSTSHNSFENVGLTSAKSTVVLHTPVNTKIQLTHDEFTVHSGLEISDVQSINVEAFITHNTENVKSGSPTVLLTEAGKGCEPLEIKCFPSTVESEKIDIPVSVIPSIEKPNLVENSNSSSKIHSDTFDAKLDERIKYLERFLEKLDRKIKKLNARDCSLEEMDDEDGVYIQEDRYKRKFIKVWEKICSLKKCSSRFRRETDKQFVYAGTRFEPVNKAIEKFINEREPSERFPNFTEVLDVVKKVNEIHDLGLSIDMVEHTAREVFNHVGQELKKRRLKDYMKDFGCHLTDNINLDDDPANHDENLNRTLTDSFSIGEKKITEIIDKYANKNVEDINEVDANIEGDECGGSDQEPKEDNEFPETDPADNSDDEVNSSPSPSSVVCSKRNNDMDNVSDASTEPDISRMRHKGSLISSEVLHSSVIYTKNIEIEDHNEDKSPDPTSQLESDALQRRNDNDGISDAPSEPDTSRETQYSSIVPKVNDSPVIFASDIEIVEHPDGTLEDDFSSSPGLPTLSEVLSEL